MTARVSALWILSGKAASAKLLDDIYMSISPLWYLYVSSYRFGIKDCLGREILQNHWPFADMESLWFCTRYLMHTPTRLNVIYLTVIRSTLLTKSNIVSCVHFYRRPQPSLLEQALHEEGLEGSAKGDYHKVSTATWFQNGGLFQLCKQIMPRLWGSVSVMMRCTFVRHLPTDHSGKLLESSAAAFEMCSFFSLKKAGFDCSDLVI